MLPKEIRRLALERDHLRNLEKLMLLKYPEALKKLLRKHPSFVEGMYLECGKKKTFCLECGETTRFRNFVRGYVRFCSIKCCRVNETVIAKRKATNMERFGATAPLGNEKIKAKVKKTMRKRYGCDWALSNEEVREKGMETLVRKYGVENIGSSKKVMTQDVRDKQIQSRKRTMMNRYGVAYPLQIPEIFEKQQRSAHTSKKAIVAGKEFSYQGYELKVIKKILGNGIKPKDIATVKAEGKPSIRYKAEGKMRVYHPDIFVKSKNALLEVKSEFTVGAEFTDSSLFDRVKLKLQACVDQGYKVYLIVCIGRRGAKGTIVFKEPNKLSFKELRSRIRAARAASSI